jgi:zinc transport system permease protein
MIVPVAAAQQVTRSFRTTMVLAMAVGLVASVAGLVLSYYVDVPPGPSIVLVALGTFVVLALAAVPLSRLVTAL